MDADAAVDFFFDLLDFVSSSLSSLSDLAAADRSRWMKSPLMKDRVTREGEKGALN